MERFLGESGGSVPVCWSAVACVGVAGGLVLPSTSAGGSSLRHRWWGAGCGLSLFGGQVWLRRRYCCSSTLVSDGSGINILPGHFRIDQSHLFPIQHFIFDSLLLTYPHYRASHPCGGGGCYLHVVPLVTSFRRLNTPSTCLPWVASRIGGRRDPGG